MSSSSSSIIRRRGDISSSIILRRGDISSLIVLARGIPSVSIILLCGDISFRIVLARGGASSINLDPGRVDIIFFSIILELGLISSVTVRDLNGLISSSISSEEAG